MRVMRLEGETVALRPATPDDADAIAAGFAEDPTMGEMLGMEPEDETAQFLRDSFPAVEAPEDERTDWWFAITRPGEDEPIGEIGLVDFARRHRRAGLSILVLPRHRRTGAALEAIGLVDRWAREQLGLHRLEIHTLPENEGMQRLAEAAGFTREGVLRGYRYERGRFTDNVVYSRLS